MVAKQSSDLPDSFRPRIARDVILKTTPEGGASAYSPTSDRTCELNGTAAFVLSLCDGESGLDEMLAAVTSRFGVPPETAARDVRAVLRMLLENQIIDAGEPKLASAAPSQLRMKRFSYFPTIVFQFDLPEAETLNERLLSLIYAERDADRKGITRSNYRGQGGWHSRIDLHESPEFRDLAERVEAAAASISSELGYHESYALRVGTMWSIINPPGAANLAHVHPGCLWSGVYYVQAPRNSGKIAFTDPRTQNVMLKPKYVPKRRAPKQTWTKVSFEPVAGRMLIFPSWLYHSVDPNQSEGDEGSAERVIISFNMSQRKVSTSS